MGEQVLLKKGKWTILTSLGLLNSMQCGSAEASKLISAANYWSSTENNATNAWNFNFNNGNTNNNNKINTLSVRAIRDSSAKLYGMPEVLGFLASFFIDE